MADQKISQLNALLAADANDTDLIVIAHDIGGTPETMKMTVGEAKALFGGGVVSDLGDGSDGDVTISTPTTLTRDMYYNNLTVNDVLTTGGYRIFVLNTLDGTGSIEHKGSNGSPGSGRTSSNAGAGGAGGPSTGAGPFKTGAGGAGGGGANSGSNPGANGNPAAGSNFPVASSVGGVGGAGSSGAGGTSLGGVAAAINRLAQFAFPVLYYGIGVTSANLLDTIKMWGGTGGGGGGKNNSFSGERGGGGGGGGASGGVVFIACATFAGTLTINVSGGNGGDGESGAGAAYGGGGGGAGGNGGIAIVHYVTKTWTGTFVATGGTGGARGGNGSTGSQPGNNGTAGYMFELEIKAL